MQIFPYLKHCLKDPLLADMIKGLFNKQISYICFDPYANAFNKEPLKSPWIKDITYKRNKEGKFENAMNENIWERKFELDSLMFPLYIMCKYYLYTKDYNIFNQDFFKMLEVILKVITKSFGEICVYLAIAEFLSFMLSKLSLNLLSILSFTIPGSISIVRSRASFPN